MRAFFIASLLALAACSGGSSEHPLLVDGPLNIAHRGGAREWPEHTLLAYENCLEAGADVLEIDIWGTADGALVAIHDRSVDRTTEGTGDVTDMTLAEIQALDAGYRFGGDDHPYRGMGLAIPTFEEILDRFPDALYALEAKDSNVAVAQRMVAALQERGMEGQVSFGSFNPGPTDWVRANTEILTSMNIAEVSELLFLTEDTAPFYMPEIILSQAPAGSLDDAIIGFATDAGVTIHAWTVNDEEEMNRLLDAGVNKIITDRPSLLHDVLVERGLR